MATDITLSYVTISGSRRPAHRKFLLPARPPDSPATASSTAAYAHAPERSWPSHASLTVAAPFSLHPSPICCTGQVLWTAMSHHTAIAKKRSLQTLSSRTCAARKQRHARPCDTYVRSAVTALPRFTCAARVDTPRPTTGAPNSLAPWCTPRPQLLMPRPPGQ